MLAIGAGLTGLVITQRASTPASGPGPVPAVQAPAGPVSALPASSAATRPVARPVGLIIPAIGVRARLVELGLTAGGVLQVPRTTTVAGWYAGSPRPGAVGSSVIVGHVDSYLGPGVFFRLGLLHAAERIYVRRADGTLVVFRVTSVHTYLKSLFPTAAVYGPAPGPQLRLITCGGAFDHALRSYLSNVVVYADGIGRMGGGGRRHRLIPMARIRAAADMSRISATGKSHGGNIGAGGCLAARHRCRSERRMKRDAGPGTPETTGPRGGLGRRAVNRSRYARGQ